MRFLSRSWFYPACLFFCYTLNGQQAPAPPQVPAVPAAPAPGNPQTQGHANNGKTKPITSFLIIGTVFNEKALSFPGVQVRIRRVGEKEFAWETYTNGRGEFAVRVPPGVDYEVVVHRKKYKDQNKSVDSKVDVQQRLSIQLEPITRPNTGAKS
jgi:Carboxypeptidase regulatory-like domain